MEVDSSLKTPTTEVTETNLQEFDTCHHHAPVQKKSCSKSMQYAKVILQCYLAALVLALTVTVIVCGIKLYNKVTALEARVQSLEGQLNRTTINPVPYSLPSRPETDDKSIVALQEEVEDLNKTLASMNESLKERFAGCYEERKSKNILPINSFKYYRGCVTEVADINMNGYYTLGMRCELQTNYDGILKLSQVEVMSADKVRCWCGLTYIGRDDEAAHRPLSKNLWAVCSLVITRCPLGY